jgi:predicted DNA-binding transcriptional regulator YafY
MHRTDRLFGILLFLQSRGRASAAELAARFEVSRRTILRDMESLSAEGVPLESESGPGGGFRLMRGYFLPPLVFRPDEAWALLAGLHGLLAHGGVPRREALEQALAKLSGVMDGRTRLAAERMARRVGLQVFEAAPGPWLDRLASAAVDGEGLIITYDGPEGELEREIDPWLLYSRGGHWFVEGYCHLRQGRRVFRTDRITALRPSGRCFAPPDDLVVTAGLSSRHPPAGAQPNVRLRCSPAALRALSGHPEWAGMTVEGDVVAKWIPPSQFDFVGRFLLGFGAGVVVLEPPALREVVRSAAVAVAAAYDR